MNEVLKHTEILLDNSVKRQMQTDANLGIQLSGGLDSTLVTEIANKYSKIKKLYCSEFKNYKKNETKFAEIVAQNINVNLNKVDLNKNFFLTI